MAQIEWKEYQDDERIEEELISSSKFEHYTSKHFDEILLEDTASLDIEEDMATVSASFENTIYQSVNTGRTVRDASTDEQIAIKYLNAKVFENRINIGQLYISASMNTDPIMTGSLFIDTPGNITASGNISASGTNHTLGGDLTIKDDLIVDGGNVTINGGNVADSILKLATNTAGASDDVIIELVTDADGTPRQARIGVDHSDNTLKLVHGSGFSGGTNGICVDSGGKVGIGTATPGEKLEVVGNISSSGNIYATDYFDNGTNINTIYVQVAILGEVLNETDFTAPAATSATIASTVVVTDNDTNTDFPVVFHNESNALLDDTGAFEYNPSTGNLTTKTIRLTSTTDASATSTGHAFQSGPTNGANVIINSNEVMARNNGAVAALYLNPDGGMVAFQNSEGNSVQIDHGQITASGNISASGTVEASGFKGTPIHLRAASQYIGSTAANNYYYGNNTQGFYHHQHTGKLASLDFSGTVNLGNGVQHNTIIVPFDIKDIELMGNARTNANGSGFAMWIAKLDRPGIGADVENPPLTFLASASATPDSNTVFAKVDITGSHSFVSNMTASKGEQLVVFYQPYGGSEVHKYYWTLNARTAE